MSLQPSSGARRQTLSTMAPMVGAVLRRPALWPTAARAYRSLLPRHWWRSRPHLPLPDTEWLRYRMITAYGGDGVTVPDQHRRSSDLVDWLEWLRRWGTTSRDRP